MRKGADTRVASAVWLRSAVRISFGRIRLKLAGCQTITNHGEGRRMRFCRYSRVTSPCDLPSFHHFSPNGSRSLIGGCSSSCFEYSTGQVETDARSRFSRTAMLSYDPFDTRFGQHSPTGRTKRLAYQHLKVFSQVQTLQIYVIDNKDSVFCIS